MHSFKLPCSCCGIEVTPLAYWVPYQNGLGQHLRADCPQCGRYLKFLPQIEPYLSMGSAESAGGAA